MAGATCFVLLVRNSHLFHYDFPAIFDDNTSIAGQDALTAEVVEGTVSLHYPQRGEVYSIVIIKVFKNELARA